MVRNFRKFSIPAFTIVRKSCSGEIKLEWLVFFLFFVYYAHEHVDRSSLKRKIYFCTFIGDTNVRHLLDQLGLLRWSIIYFTYILYILDIYFIYISHTFCKYILGHFNITKTNLHSYTCHTNEVKKLFPLSLRFKTLCKDVLSSFSRSDNCWPISREICLCAYLERSCIS